jgi:acetyl-CoA C-acetyltransferase
MAELCGVVGVGQTVYASKRGDHSIASLVREAAMAAMQDAGCTWKDIDAVVIGKAPDMFEGVLMPELYLADALGAVGKPMLRVHTAGSVGGSTAIVASQLIQSGVHERVLTVTFEKQSESNAMWALSSKQPFSPHINAGAGGYFAPLIRKYIQRSKAPEYIGRMVAVKDRLNALKNPYAHLKMPDISMEKVENSPMLWEPLRYLESCPSSDGACAMVLANEKLSEQAPGAPAWVHATSMRSEATMYAWREDVSPHAGQECAKDLYKQAGITNPRKELDVAEIYVPFSWFEPMWMENLGFAEESKGWEMTDEGATALEGDMPINASGGVLSSNAIGASGMIRFGEAAMQVRGSAGEHQVDGIREALKTRYAAGDTT